MRPSPMDAVDAVECERSGAIFVRTTGAEGEECGRHVTKRGRKTYTECGPDGSEPVDRGHDLCDGLPSAFTM